MAEFSQYNVLKEADRAKLTKKPSQPDIEKIKKDVRSEMEAEFRKKNKRSHFELTFESSRLYLHIKR